jgi:epoxyqueuosine reductase
MMNKMVALMEHEFGPVKCHSFVDSGLVMEKAWAQRCGVGWRGKNTLLINRHHGSWFFIGILLTDLQTKHDTPEKDYCGNCDRCMRACPTGALEAPHVLNPLKCISYHTIETNDALPEDLRGLFGNRMFGCDICQEACPFNGKPLVSDDPGCLPDPRLAGMRKKDWVTLGREEFGTIFKDTPVIRTGYDTLMRNIRFVTEK